MEDVHTRWPHRWLHEKAEPRRSPIEGTGVFAKEDIPKGEVVAVLGGVIVPKSEIAEYRKVIGDYGIQIDDNFFIVPTSRQEPQEYGVFNHSCEPNIGLSSSLSFVTIRDIKKEEELMFDYAFSESEEDAFFVCQCGTPSCRKDIKHDDWQRKDLQEKYGNYFSPYLRAKFG
jgi:SET domain-containing protein